MTKSKRIVQIQEGNFVEGIVKALQTKYPTLDKGNLEQIAKQQIGNHRVLNSVVLSDHDYQGLLRDAQISTERSHLISCARRIHQAIEDGETTLPQLLEILQVALNTNTTYVPEGIDEAAYLQSNRAFAKSILIGVGGNVPVNLSNRITMATDEACLARMVVDTISGFFTDTDKAAYAAHQAWSDAYINFVNLTLKSTTVTKHLREIASTVENSQEARGRIVATALHSLDVQEKHPANDKHVVFNADKAVGAILTEIADHLDPSTDNSTNLKALMDDYSGESRVKVIKQYFETIASAYSATSGSKALVAVMSAFVGKMSEQSDTMFVQKFLTGNQYEAVNEVVNILRHEFEHAGMFSFNLEEFNKVNNCMPHIGQKDLGITLSRSAEGDLMLQFNGVQNVSKL